MEEEVENGDKNTIVANEDENYETPEIIQERKIEGSRKKREALQ